MHRFSPDHFKDPNLPGEISRARAERLLLDAKNAAALPHKLALIDIESAHRLAWRRSHFDPNQPRVPAGHADGGQWTKAGAGESRSDPRIISDATPDDDWRPGARYATNRSGRGSVPMRIGGRLVEVEPGQASRLAAAQARAHDAIASVRELDPNWRPRPSAYESVEGLIRTYEAEALQAHARIAELGRVGIGPGPFAAESIPARGPGRDFYVWERREANRIFYERGCHTCGTFNPGTSSGNCILDHQLPSALNHVGRPQRLFPQCLTCSLRQGGWISIRGSDR